MKTNKETYGIKKKLTAAGAMLLVAAIMMVSTTYAWFTLSTAPEVKGISTSVGANGNLEIALSPMTSANGSDIKTGTSDSMQAVGRDMKESNITWGNLVDLSDPAYGLTQIKLMPAVLNKTEGTVPINSGILKIAEYGYDGRVMSLSDKTVTGVYGYTTGSEIGEAITTNFPVSGLKGVRAIGVSAEMSPQAAALTAAKVGVATSIAAAKSAASNAIAKNGSALANIAVRHANAGEDGGEVYSYAEVTALKDTIAKLESAQKALEDAVKNVVRANKAADTADDKAGTVVALDQIGIDYTGTTATISVGEVEVTDIAILTPVLEELKEINTAVSGAKTAFPNAAYVGTEEDPVNETTTFDWDQIGDCVEKLVNVNGVKVNGVQATTLNTEEAVNALINAVMAGGKGIVVEFGKNSGVLSQIADFAGSYSASVTLTNVSAGGVVADTLPATMNVVPEEGKNHGASMTKNVADLKADKGTATNPTVTDTYGYALDFYFRTNAANSNLLLQTEGKQRVYGDSTNAQTQGEGSYMTFMPESSMTDEQVKGLLEAIRIAFVGSDGTILEEARLDNPTVTAGTEAGTLADEYKAPVYLVDKDDASEKKTTNDIVALEQNKATAITVIVYLDGEAVQNKDVANAASSLTGTMNLQFASDATLQPMKDTSLYSGENVANAD